MLDTDLRDKCKSWFAYCPPGLHPHSHNIVEALAVGTIPIFNYGSVFYPRLKHLESFIEYSGSHDVADGVQLALSLPVETRREMSDNVLRIYREEIDLSADFLCRSNRIRVCDEVPTTRKFLRRTGQSQESTDAYRPAN